MSTAQSSEWAQLPFKPTVPVNPFTLDVPAQEVSDFKTLLNLSRLAPPTYENTQTEKWYGPSHSWMSNALQTWKTSYDWSARQKAINRHPQFKASITDDDGTSYDTHFAALFSKRPDALPVVFLHGWPGSFLEFLDILDLIRTQYQPDTSPYHIVVPSLIGYPLSSAPRMTADWDFKDGCRTVDKLMQALGFGGGYVAQGGDVGGIMSPTLGQDFESVKGIHVNLILDPLPPGVANAEDDPDLSENDKFKLQHGKTFNETGFAYARHHATRPATAGFTQSSNPIALLAWIGEKMVEWVDPNKPLPIETILDNITLYWFSNAAASNLWPYRNLMRPQTWRLAGLQKPFGYSRFRYDIDSRTKKQIEQYGNLTFFKDHEQGGHFAALERPEALWADVEEYLKAVFPDKFVHTKSKF